MYFLYILTVFVVTPICYKKNNRCFGINIYHQSFDSNKGFGYIPDLDRLIQGKFHKKQIGLPGNSHGILDILFNSRAKRSKKLGIFLRAKIVDFSRHSQVVLYIQKYIKIYIIT